MKSSNVIIEVLESRVAPAAVFTFTDVDGDTVTVQTTKGQNPDLAAIITPHLVTTSPGHQQLQEIDFSANSGTFDKTSLTITAKRGPTGGDGLVNIGYIDATIADGDGAELDLGAVSIDGDLGKIFAGDSGYTTPGLASLTVQSLGRFGTSTGASDLASTIKGPVGALTVKSDVVGAQFRVVSGDLDSVKIGGSLIGGAATESGQIFTNMAMGPVTIGGDIVGGSGVHSGYLSSIGDMTRVKVGGSVIGGSANTAGAIICDRELGPVTIGHDVRGGTAQSSGEISAAAKMGAVTVGGSVIGGAAPATGQIVTQASGAGMGAVKIGGDVVGGFANDSGQILSSGKLGSVTIGGSVLGGTGTMAGAVKSSSDMGALRIGHDVIGGTGLSSGYILSEGKLASATIGGSIIGGTQDYCGYVGAEEDAGPVSVGGDLRGSTGQYSGQLNLEGPGKTVFIGGSLYGGSNDDTGTLNTNDDLTSIKIMGDVHGGAGDNSGSIFTDSGKPVAITIGGSLIGGSGESTGILDLYHVGAITIGGDIRGGDNATPDTLFDTGAIIGHNTDAPSIKVGGSIIAGTNTGSGLVHSGAICIFGQLDSLTIGGSVVGSTAGTDVEAVIIALANMSLKSPTSADIAIGKITIGGRVEHASIMAGADLSGSVLNADAQIGSVSVSGDWIASSMAAGVSAGPDGDFGTTDDGKPSMPMKDNATALSKIASVVIKGQALGSIGGMEHYGIVSQQIGSLKIGSTAIPLTAGAGNDLMGITLGATGNFTALEVAVP